MSQWEKSKKEKLLKPSWTALGEKAQWGHEVALRAGRRRFLSWAGGTA